MNEVIAMRDASGRIRRVEVQVSNAEIVRRLIWNFRVPLAALLAAVLLAGVVKLTIYAAERVTAPAAEAARGYHLQLAETAKAGSTRS